MAQTSQPPPTEKEKEKAPSHAVSVSIIPATPLVSQPLVKELTGMGEESHSQTTTASGATGKLAKIQTLSVVEKESESTLSEDRPPALDTLMAVDGEISPELEFPDFPTEDEPETTVSVAS